MDPYATHLQALITTALRTTGPILELGCGDYSTPLLAAFANEQGRRLLVQASDWRWLSRYEALGGEQVEIEQVDWKTWTPPVAEPKWGFVFLDSEQNTADRIRHLPALLEVTDLVVLHDADHSMKREGWEKRSAGWQIIEHYFEPLPQTVVLRKRRT